MSKIILDTNIYIDFINTCKHSNYVFTSDYPEVLFLSSVVLMELYAGAHTKRDVDIIDRLKKPFKKRGMIISPEPNTYLLAGQVLAKLQKNKGYSLKKSYSLSHDVLIALSARQMGATVITANKKDFMAIQEEYNFSLKTIK